jgi:hypothetical protein
MPDPRVISFKCKCFRILGKRFVYPRNDVTKESIKFEVESLQTSSKYHFGSNTTLAIGQKIGPLSARPSRVHSGQKISVSFPSESFGNDIRVFLGWFDLQNPMDHLLWQGVSKIGVMDLTIDLPTLPRDKWLELRVEQGDLVISKSLWSNGDKIEGRWNSSNPAAVLGDYCCGGNVEHSESHNDFSYHSYENFVGDPCRVVAVAFTVLNGLINGSDSIPLSGFSNSGLPIHNKWSIEEVGYYGMERPVVYKWGNVIDGRLIGLPDSWSPPVYGFTGYMNLTLRC